MPRPFDFQQQYAEQPVEVGGVEPLTVAVIEDDPCGSWLYQALTTTVPAGIWQIHRFGCVFELNDPTQFTPDVIFLERHMPALGITDTYIPTLQSASRYAPVILFADQVSATLATSGAYFGAFATISAGQLQAMELVELTLSAACSARIEGEPTLLH